MWLIEKIIASYQTGTEFDHLFSPDSPFLKFHPRGIPIGNLTSQIFVNILLDPLDQYVKHTLKVKYYIRYVDDFVLLAKDKKYLGQMKHEIQKFLREKLFLELHPRKQTIAPVDRGIDFLGYIIFKKHLLLRKSNKLKFQKKLQVIKKSFLRAPEGSLKQAEILAYAISSISAWLAHARHAKTKRLRKRIFGEDLTSKDKSKIEEFVKNWKKEENEVSKKEKIQLGLF